MGHSEMNSGEKYAEILNEYNPQQEIISLCDMNGSVEKGENQRKSDWGTWKPKNE